MRTQSRDGALAYARSPALEGILVEDVPFGDGALALARRDRQETANPLLRTMIATPYGTAAFKGCECVPIYEGRGVYAEVWLDMFTIPDRDGLFHTVSRTRALEMEAAYILALRRGEPIDELRERFRPYLW